MTKFENCGNCRYWNTVFNCDWGMCKRNPPREQEGYPCARRENSCGEFCDKARISTRKVFARKPVAA